MKPEIINYRIGDILQIEWISRSFDGKPVKPIGRAETGIIVIIDRESKEFYEPESVWGCEVKEVHPKKLVVTPVYCVRTKIENLKHKESQIKELKDTFKKSTERFEKPKKQFQFLSKQEILRP